MPSLGPDPIEILQTSIDDVSIKNFNEYFRNLAIVNSPGTGKTRVCLELGKSTPMVYLLCCPVQMNEINSVPHPAVAEMLQALMNANLSERQKIALKIIDSICMAADSYSSAEELYNAQWTKDFKMDGEFFVKLINCWKTAKAKTPEKVKKVHFNMEKIYCESAAEISTDVGIQVSGCEDIPDIKSTEPQPESPIHSRLLICFDEACGLNKMEDASNFFSPIRTIQRAINNDSYSHVIGLYLSTSSTSETLLPGHSNSNRLTNTKDPPLVLNILSFDVFTDTGEKLFLGRPLWHQLYKYSSSMNNGKSDKMNILKFACKMLTNNSYESNLDKNSAIAIFCCRISMTILSSSADNITAHHMGIMIEGQSKSRLVKKCIYYSEPMLVEASAYITYKYQNFAPHKIIPLLLEDWSNVVETSSGDRGEIAAAAAILYSLDNLRSNNFPGDYDLNYIDRNFSSTVRADDFFKSISSQSDPELMEILRHYEIKCNHFVRVANIDDQSCNIAIERYAGLICPKGYPGVDLIIFLQGDETCNNKTAFISVQVKNLKNDISLCNLNNIFHTMDTLRYSCTDMFKACLGVRLVIGVGAGDVNKVFREENYYDTRSTECVSRACNFEISTHLKSFSEISEETRDVLLDLCLGESILQENIHGGWPKRRCPSSPSSKIDNQI